VADSPHGDADPSSNSSFAELKEQLYRELDLVGLEDLGLRVHPVYSKDEFVHRLATFVQFLQQQGVSIDTAVYLVWQHQHPAVACNIHTNLGPKLQLFKELVAAEPGWADALVKAFTSSSADVALSLPVPAFEAALHFLAAQLQRVSRRWYQQLGQPSSLLKFVQLRPDFAGDLLSRHPQQFTEHAAPWLQQQLGWDDAALADAALCDFYKDFCSSWDSQRAQDCLEWLLGLGVSAAQAGELLRADMGLLVDPERQLSHVQAMVDKLAATLGVGARLASSLVLSQPGFKYNDIKRTGQLIMVLQVR
jgi:hypothetical protein